MTGTANPGDGAERPQSLLSSWSDVPAVLIDRHLTVVESNRLAKALTPGFVPGVNLVRFAFLDPELDLEVGLWGPITRQLAGMLKEALEEGDEDAAFHEVIGELSARSRAFSVTWAEEPLPVRRTGRAIFVGTQAGDVELRYTLFRVPGDGQETVIVLGSGNSSSRSALRALGESTGPDRPA